MEDETFDQLMEALRNANHDIPNKNSKILLVDFLNTFIRAFAASPASNTNGEHCGGLTGFLASLGNAIRITGATRCIIISDGNGSTERKRKLFPGYKSGRSMKLNLNRTYNFKDSDEESASMKLQLVRLVDYLEQLPVQFITIDNCEADDVIAYLVNNIFIKEDEHSTIMSSDKDFYQLINDKVNVWSPTKKRFYEVDDVVNEYGIHPNNFAVYKAMLGDKSDSIPGIKGLGDKTIRKYFPFLALPDVITLDEFIERVEVISNEFPNIKIFKVILDSKDLLKLNEEIMQLKYPLISANSISKINTEENQLPYQFNRFLLLQMSIKDGIQHAIPNISDWAFKIFSTMNSYNHEMRRV